MVYMSILFCVMQKCVTRKESMWSEEKPFPANFFSGFFLRCWRESRFTFVWFNDKGACMFRITSSWRFLWTAFCGQNFHKWFQTIWGWQEEIGNSFYKYNTWASLKDVFPTVLCLTPKGQEAANLCVFEPSDCDIPSDKLIVEIVKQKGEKVNCYISFGERTVSSITK